VLLDYLVKGDFESKPARITIIMPATIVATVVIVVVKARH